MVRCLVIDPSVEKMTVPEVVEIDVSELVGMQVNAKVIQETYNGDVVNRIKKIYPAA